MDEKEPRLENSFFFSNEKLIALSLTRIHAEGQSKKKRPILERWQFSGMTLQSQIHSETRLAIKIVLVRLGFPTVWFLELLHKASIFAN